MIFHTTVSYHAKTNFRTFCANARGKLRRSEHDALFTRYAEPGVLINREVGPAYTVAIYTNLLSCFSAVTERATDAGARLSLHHHHDIGRHRCARCRS